MGRVMKYIYAVFTTVYTLLTAYEVYVYMKMEGNYAGIFYLFFSFFVMFLLFTSSYNFKKSNKNIRVSKNIIAILVGLFTSFILATLLPNIFNYKDSSLLFYDTIFVISKIVKPIMYLMLGALCIIECKKIKYH